MHHARESWNLRVARGPGTIWLDFILLQMKKLGLRKGMWFVQISPENCMRGISLAKLFSIGRDHCFVDGAPNEVVGLHKCDMLSKTYAALNNKVYTEPRRWSHYWSHARTQTNQSNSRFPSCISPSPRGMCFLDGKTRRITCTIYFYSPSTPSILVELS